MNLAAECAFLLWVNVQEAGMEEQSTKPTPLHLLDRVRAVLGTLELDCRCRGKLEDALGRFETLETRRQLRALILDARHQAERIAALLELVSELDTVTTEEADLGVFDEIALLFADIGLAAACGAEDMTRAKDLASRREEATRAPGDRDGQ